MPLTLLSATWLLAIVVAGAAGVFDPGPGRPPLALLGAIVVPPALFLLAYRVSAAFRRFVLSLDLRLLTAVQAWRVLGGMFLVLYAFNLRPALFAFPAGLGDVAVGVAAVFVLRAMIDSHPNWRRRVRLLNLGGLLDFVGAITTGVLTSNSSARIAPRKRWRSAPQWAPGRRDPPRLPRGCGIPPSSVSSTLNAKVEWRRWIRAALRLLGP